MSVLLHNADCDKMLSDVIETQYLFVVLYAACAFCLLLLWPVLLKLWLSLILEIGSCYIYDSQRMVFIWWWHWYWCCTLTVLLIITILSLFVSSSCILLSIALSLDSFVWFVHPFVNNKQLTVCATASAVLSTSSKISMWRACLYSRLFHQKVSEALLHFLEMCMSVLQHQTLLYKIRTLLSLLVNSLLLESSHRQLWLEVSLRVVTSLWSSWQLMPRVSLILALSSFPHMVYASQT